MDGRSGGAPITFKQRCASLHYSNSIVELGNPREHPPKSGLLSSANANPSFHLLRRRFIHYRLGNPWNVPPSCPDFFRSQQHRFLPAAASISTSRTSKRVYLVCLHLNFNFNLSLIAYVVCFFRKFNVILCEIRNNSLVYFKLKII